MSKPQEPSFAQMAAEQWLQNALAVARRIVGQDAHDVVQQTVLELLGSPPRRSEDHWAHWSEQEQRAYFLRAVRNRAISAIRRKGRDSTQLGEDVNALAQPEREAVHEMTERFRSQLEELFNDPDCPLSKDGVMRMRLRLINGLGLGEAADLLGETRRLCKSRGHRARGELRNFVQKKGLAEFGAALTLMILLSDLTEAGGEPTGPGLGHQNPPESLTPSSHSALSEGLRGVLDRNEAKAAFAVLLLLLGLLGSSSLVNKETRTAAVQENPALGGTNAQQSGLALGPQKFPKRPPPESSPGKTPSRARKLDPVEVVSDSKQEIVLFSGRVLDETGNSVSGHELWACFRSRDSAVLKTVFGTKEHPQSLPNRPRGFLWSVSDELIRSFGSSPTSKLETGKSTFYSFSMNSGVLVYRRASSDRTGRFEIRGPKTASIANLRRGIIAATGTAGEALVAITPGMARRFPVALGDVRLKPRSTLTVASSPVNGRALQVVVHSKMPGSSGLYEGTQGWSEEGRTASKWVFTSVASQRGKTARNVIVGIEEKPEIDPKTHSSMPTLLAADVAFVTLRSRTEYVLFEAKRSANLRGLVVSPFGEILTNRCGISGRLIPHRRDWEPKDPNTVPTPVIFGSTDSGGRFQIGERVHPQRRYRLQATAEFLSVSDPQNYSAGKLQTGEGWFRSEQVIASAAEEPELSFDSTEFDRVGADIRKRQWFLVLPPHDKHRLTFPRGTGSPNLDPYVDLPRRPDGSVPRMLVGPKWAAILFKEPGFALSQLERLSVVKPR